ncbi:carbohydrate-binding domain-containing protein [Phototrophicus methaneseepsis]|uniref:Carbohydrate-binding domain-containing protein n=1 Tax=Phototrophicus methaneseepsis TaxID=2710758 RepID=A0A7S8IEP9_9CHLR|nr:carbohydrate-binding domain-containing protein [Phototrophicus methaneseepsis]QPC82033.1 carbohydrate-binding domain-containing protein [Phototrophicus methaneseepsis]
MKAVRITAMLLGVMMLLTIATAVFAQETTYTADTTISLSDDAISVEGNGASVEGHIVTITSAGTYSISGTLADGQVTVDSEDEAAVVLILNGVDISSTTSAPINIANAEEVVLVLADGTENFVSDASTYVYENEEDDEPNAAVFSDDDMTITGSGSLTVEANFNDGIASKDSLTITGGTLNVTSVDDGIRGKDSLVIDGATITITSEGDALKSDEDEDAELGYITIESGTFNITAGGDGIQAETDLTINDGTFNISTAGGSTATIDEDLSAKGIKAGAILTINGGTFDIDTGDDAVHANDTVIVNNGTFNIATGDDALHADLTLEINGGDINITRSYEGIESSVITFNAGNIHVVSSDDGVNASGGDTETTEGTAQATPEDMGTPPENNGEFTGTPPEGAQDRGPGGNRFPGGNGNGGFPGGGFGEDGDNYIYFNGGTIVIDAEGDGIDANGSIEMSGGVVIVNGPTMSMNGALDYNVSFNITGGTLVAVGSNGMAQAPSQSSTQYVMMVNLDASQPEGTLLHIESSDGESILTFAPTKAYQSIVVSSPDIEEGATYTIYTGGSADGTATDGLYTESSYIGGIQSTSLTVSGIVTQIGNGGGRGPR